MGAKFSNGLLDIYAYFGNGRIAVEVGRCSGKRRSEVTFSLPGVLSNVVGSRGAQRSAVKSARGACVRGSLNKCQPVTHPVALA